jgi:hypothetical protein
MLPSFLPSSLPPSLPPFIPPPFLAQSLLSSVTHIPLPTTQTQKPNKRITETIYKTLMRELTKNRTIYKTETIRKQYEHNKNPKPIIAEIRNKITKH